MKITVDLDCSPQEAREFLGLPDVKPLQDAFMENMQEKISSGLSREDMEKMFQLWIAPGLKAPDLKAMGQNMEAFQNMFWNVAKSDKE